MLYPNYFFEDQTILYLINAVSQKRLLSPGPLSSSCKLAYAAGQILKVLSETKTNRCTGQYKKKILKKFLKNSYSQG